MKQSTACDKCGGKGFVRVQGGHQECPCLADRKLERKYLDSGIKEVFIGKKLSDFRPGEDKYAITTVKAISRALEKGKLPNGAVFLTGDRGCGKSLLASLIVMSAIRGGFPANLVGLQTLSDIYFGKEGRYGRVEDLLLPTKVLALEVGQEFTSRVMGYLICQVHRHFREAGKFLVYTSQYSISEMSRVYGKDVEVIFSDASEVKALPIHLRGKQ